MTSDQISLLRRTVTANLSEDEHALFLAACERTGLDPFGRYLYVTHHGREAQIQTSIDGMRLTAERTGKYAGQVGPHWCGADGAWKSIWTSNQPPVAARVGILRSDFQKPIWGKALYSEFTQGTEFWDRMACNQIAKCAEALGFRKAFPRELSGLYTTEEMAQAKRVYAGEPVSRNQPFQSGPIAQPGDDPAPVPGSLGALSSESRHARSGNPGHGGEDHLFTVLPAVPFPLQPFVDAGMSRKNIQAAFGFIQCELERKLGEAGTKRFREIWLRLPRVFKTREEARLKTISCWCEMWAALEAERKPEAA